MKKNNNGIFYVVISLVAVLAIAGGVRAYTNAQNQTINTGGGDYIYNEAEQEGDNDMDYGAVPGPDVYNRMYFHSGYQSGGTTFASSTLVAAVTVASAEIDQDVYYISYSVNDANTTLTFPASTTAYWLGNNAGDTREYYLYSATSTTASTLTLAAGTGMDLQEDEGETVVLNGLEACRLTFIRKVDSDILMIAEVFQVAD